MIKVLQQSHEKFMAAISGLTSEQLNYKQSIKTNGLLLNVFKKTPLSRMTFLTI
jgi:hypothetical protein